MWPSGSDVEGLFVFDKPKTEVDFACIPSRCSSYSNFLEGAKVRPLYMLPVMASAEAFLQTSCDRNEIIGERKSRPHSNKRFCKSTHLPVGNPARDTGPGCDDSLLDRHNSIEVGYESSLGCGGDIGERWTSKSADFLDKFGSDADERRDLNIGTLRIRPHNVAGLRQNDKAENIL
jgi:hypothetical protein